MIQSAGGLLVLLGMAAATLPVGVWLQASRLVDRSQWGR
jgi:hypothetical protein